MFSILGWCREILTVLSKLVFPSFSFAVLFLMLKNSNSHKDCLPVTGELLSWVGHVVLSMCRSVCADRGVKNAICLLS